MVSVEGIDKVMGTIEAALRALRSEADKVRSLAKAIPSSSQEIEEALMELAAAQEDCNCNFRNWDRAQNPDIYDQSEECRDHWSMALNRKEKAMNRLISIGEILRDHQG